MQTSATVTLRTMCVSMDAGRRERVSGENSSRWHTTYSRHCFSRETGSVMTPAVASGGGSRLLPPPV